MGYDRLSSETTVLAHALAAEPAALVLAESPFYATSGGQMADTGVVEGAGWRFVVSDVRKDAEHGQLLLGTLEGEFAPGPVAAQVDADRRRDMQRNHSATHLAHLALRRALGPHVRQQGSLVAPDRLRFDFSHHGPIEPSQLSEIEAAVNELIWANDPTDIREMPLNAALELGAMAFFADKYGDVVRVVTIGESIELCGGTHVTSAGDIGLFRFTAQGGVAAGVRRIEAVTGRASYARLNELDARIAALATTLHAQPDQLERKLEALLAEREKLERRLAEALAQGGVREAQEFDAGRVRFYLLPTVVEGRAELGELADQFRVRHPTNAVLALVNPTVPQTITIAVSDDLAADGHDANLLIKELTARHGGRGGGRKTFASGSLEGNAESVATDSLLPLLRERLG